MLRPRTARARASDSRGTGAFHAAPLRCSRGCLRTRVLARTRCRSRAQATLTSMWRITLCLAACMQAAPPPAAPAIEPSLLAVRDDAFGPLTAQTPATLVALRGALAGFDVAPINA